jgi:hypothetical protein
MRNKKTLKNTMNSQVYKKALRINFGCQLCPPNKGCNTNRDNDSQCWKSHRDKRWRD